MSRFDEEKKQLTKALIRQDLLREPLFELRWRLFLLLTWLVCQIFITWMFFLDNKKYPLAANIFMIVYLIVSYVLMAIFVTKVWKYIRKIRSIKKMEDNMISVTVDTVTGKNVEERIRYVLGRVYCEVRQYVFFSRHSKIRPPRQLWYDLLDEGETCYVVTLLPNEETAVLFYPTDFYHFRDDLSDG